MSKESYNSALSRLVDCLSELYIWFSHNCLALNPDKTDIILCGTSQRAKTSSNLNHQCCWISSFPFQRYENSVRYL